MHNTREKLIQLIEEEYYCSIEEMADHMIANGVTIQQWIPVTERLPENDQFALCFMKDKSFGTFRVFQWNYIDWQWNDGNEWYDENDVTHWMPLPEPPKEEKPFHYEKGNQPHGAEQFAKACAVCVNNGSALCKDCKAEKKSGFEPPF